MTINKLLLKKLNLDDYREFAEALGNWAYTTDFTYQDHVYDPNEGATFNKFLERFVRDYDKSRLH